MLQELLTRLTDAGANGVNMKITQQGERAIVIIQPLLNPMPYDSTAEGLKIHAAMQSPVIINAELSELDTELHVVVADYIASFEGGMQSSNVKEVVTQHATASLVELSGKPVPVKDKKGKGAAPVGRAEQVEPACVDSVQEGAEPSTDDEMSMSDFESLFISTASNQ